MTTTFPNEPAEITIVANAGQHINVGQYLSQLFSGGGYSTYWFYNDDNFDNERGFWGNVASHSYFTLNGVAQAEGFFNVAPAQLNNVEIAVGNEICCRMLVRVNTGVGPNAGDSTWTQFWIKIVPAVYVDPTPQTIDGSDVVAAARLFGALFAGSYSPAGCHDIAAAFAAAAGAPLPLNSGSLVPTENRDGGLWTVVHRGDVNLVSNWQSLLQPGDIVRYDYADPSKTQHTFTVLSLSGDTVESLDNFNNSLGFHFTNFELLANPATVTIYRITSTHRLLEGSAGQDTLYGSTLNDKLVGIAGDDVLNGGSGADIMIGGPGNDSYVVENVADIVTELAGEGTNSVTSTVSHTLPAHVENLTLLAAGGAINGTGNDLANVITGNASANALDGGAGNDTLRGNAGNDTLIGGADTDTAIFSGNRLDYFIRYFAATQTFEFTDQRSGSPDGTDTASGIEQFQFANGVIAATAANAQQVFNADGSRTVNDIAGTQPWSSYTEAFDGGGNRVSQTGINDNGSSWQVAFDPANTQPWTWVNNEYSSGGQRTTQTGLNDNGTNWQVTFDVAGNQPWTWVDNEYSAAGNRTAQTGLNDNGTNWQVTFDAAGNQPWTWYDDEFAANGRRSGQTGLNDDGSNWQVTFDAANNQPWTWISNEYSAAGKRTTQTGLNDDGSNWQVLFDHDNSKPWVWQNDEFAANGRRSGQTGLNDDGSNWQAFFDAASNQPWTWVRNEYAASGPRSGQTGLNDDGSTWQVIFDPASTQPWTWVNNEFNASGQRFQQTGLNDDGSNWQSAFDVGNTQVWTWIRDEFNAAGQRTSQTALNDDGTNWQTLYDVANVQPWAWQTTHYDAAGHMVSQNGINDDGSVWHI